MRTSRNPTGVAKKKIKSARKDAKTQRTRKVFQRPSNNKSDFLKAFLCGTFAALRLCVKVFAFFYNDCTLNGLKALIVLPKIVLPSKQA